jgi:hypothetical protein
MTINPDQKLNHLEPLPVVIAIETKRQVILMINGCGFVVSYVIRNE